MANKKIVVLTANQLCLNGFEYKWWALIVKNVINFFVAIGLLLSQFLGLAVGLLQLLQPEPHTTNTSFLSLLIGELGLEGTPKTPKLWENIGFAD